MTSYFKLAALAIVLLTVAIRLPSLHHPQPIDDEAIYSVVANVIVDGGRPYVDAVERKPPFLFWTYAAVVEATGKFNWKALHMVALIWTLGTMVGLFVIGKGLFDRDTGLIAALLYSVFQPWGEWRDLAFNGESVMNLPIVWAWAIGFRRSPSRVRPELFSRRGASLYRLSAQTAGSDRGRSTRSLSSSSKLSRQPPPDSNGFARSSRNADDRILWNAWCGSDRAPATRHPPPSLLLDD